MIHEHRRIAVVGTSASGKTTFARSYAQKAGIPHVELDAFHWGPNWTPREDFRERLDSALEEDSWITDGNYKDVRELIWTRATALVWLDYSFPTVFGRAVWRTIRRCATGEELYGGNRERFAFAFLNPDGIPWWVVRTYLRRKRSYSAVPETHPHLDFIRLRNPAEAEALLAAMPDVPTARGAETQ